MSKMFRDWYFKCLDNYDELSEEEKADFNEFLSSREKDDLESAKLLDKGVIYEPRKKTNT